VEYFEYLARLLKQSGAGHVRVFGGGGGVIVPAEVTRLAKAGVRIFSPEDGQRLGLPGMINELIRECDVDLAAEPAPLEAVLAGDRRALARTITCLQAGRLAGQDQAALAAAAGSRTVPVLGITGTGGSGKSSLTDELVRRLRIDQQDKLRVAVLAVDPTRRRGGGALLGDRIRMNALHDHFLGLLLEQPCRQRAQLFRVAAKHPPLKLVFRFRFQRQTPLQPAFFCGHQSPLSYRT
jgi:methylmalonyl-CoA mutase